jgi:hypothetical protein
MRECIDRRDEELPHGRSISRLHFSAWPSAIATDETRRDGMCGAYTNAQQNASNEKQSGNRGALACVDEATQGARRKRDGVLQVVGANRLRSLRMRNGASPASASRGSWQRDMGLPGCYP